MRILVTGSDGYIGSVLAPQLTEAGHQVHGLDTGFYVDGMLFRLPGAFDTQSRKDIRQMGVEDVRGYDAVVHMAELSNDPLGSFNEHITHQINHLGSVHLAELCKQAGVERFVYTSSCSVYGLGDSSHRTETSVTDPQTAYARCKVLVERDVGAMADDGFTPTFLRNATAFGASPRMRFDIVLNNLSGLAWTTQEIALTSDGSPWRPLVHVDDICQAIRCTLAAPREAVHGQIFNVGSTSQNYQVRDIAGIVSEAFPGCSLSVGPSDGDNRSYRVSFEKIHEQLPGFVCRRDARYGAEELRDLFERIQLTPDDFEFRAFTRLRQLEHLVSQGRVDERLFWTPRGAAGVREQATGRVPPVRSQDRQV
jgi:nucleoside-diphosphate-sugar epimerase